MGECPDLRDGRCRCVRFTHRAWAGGLAAYVLVYSVGVYLYATLKPGGALAVACAIALTVGVIPISLQLIWWIDLRNAQHARLARVHTYSLERDIEALEQDLGVGLGEEWWKP